MVEMDVIYQGELHCEATHIESGSRIETDAPKDNQGRGERFSPTDLVGAALGTCILTLMGIYAKRHGLDITGTKVHMVKEMASAPKRRIGKLTATITLPRPIADEKHRRGLEGAAHGCPVHASLHPDIEIVMNFVW